jgi:acetylornithine deacetylase/succinyl-diaminopimelate desuccinylase-like protein
MNALKIDRASLLAPAAVLTGRCTGRLAARLLLCAAGAVSGLPAGAGTLAAAGAHDAKAREIFARVIAFRTSEGLGQVPAMAGYLAGEFRAAGFPDEDIHVLPLEDTASLVVRYRGDGSGGRPIALLAHMDVVTAQPEDWERDPFALIEEKGYFFGRGTSDNKSGVASLTATFLRLKAEGFVPTRDLVIVFTGDEETTQKTTQDLVTRHRDLVDAEFALNSDGGGGTLDEETGKALSYSLQTAEKTYASFELTTHNPGGHSSAPRADNAIYELADALKRIQGYRFPVMTNDTTLAYFAATGRTTPGALGEAMRRFARDLGDAGAADALAASPSHVGMTRTTCVATMLRGGHAENALPQSATATVNCRIFPGVAVEAVRAQLQELAGPAVAIRTLHTPTSSGASALRADVIEAVTRAVHARHPGIPIVPYQASGATDGLYFRAAGIPTYGVGEVFSRNSDEFAHGLNERVPVQSFYDGLEYWHALLTDLAGR